MCHTLTHTDTHWHRHTLTQTHTLFSCVCMCVVCASVQSIFAPHLLMTLKPTRGGGLQPGWGACVSSTLAVRLMSAATATIPLIEEGIVDSTPRQTSYTAGSGAHVVGCRSREIGLWTPHDDSLVLKDVFVSAGVDWRAPSHISCTSASLLSSDLFNPQTSILVLVRLQSQLTFNVQFFGSE